ncbi:hypothetical protein GC174_09330 [bacterium]|nr:hypothetical protein [bacterium]
MRVLICLLLALTFMAPAFAKSVEVDTDKVLVVMVYSNSCKKFCDEVRPMLAKIEDKYGDKVAVHMLGISGDDLARSKEMEKKLGISGFLPGMIDHVPAVGIFSPKRKLVKEIISSKKFDQYTRYIDVALKAK